MKAAYVRPKSPSGTPYAFPGRVAPPSAIEIRDNVPKPEVLHSGEMLIRVKGSTVYRDNLEWNELYPPGHAKLGNDFAGVVVSVHESEREYRVGDHVYGMANADRGGQWAEYAIVKTDEATLKPDILSWEEAAALPGSALTADQALFVQAGLATNAQGLQSKRILITGASGCAGTFLVQFAVAAGHHVVAATSSKPRNEKTLQSLGAHEIVEYSDFVTLSEVDVIIDSVGLEVLSDCWSIIKPNGIIISFDSCSWNYIEDAKNNGLNKDKEGVRAIYFIVEPSRNSMERISEHVREGTCKGQVMKTVSLDEAPEAYVSVHSRGMPHGKIVVVP